MKVNIFWFRRDLRLDDNHGLYRALSSNLPVLPIFIFDRQIIDELPKDDSRITFIYKTLAGINDALHKAGSTLAVYHGKPLEVWGQISNDYEIDTVFANHDYEPYAIDRDNKTLKLLQAKGIKFCTFKDQVIFEKGEVLKDDGKPYTIYTPFKNKWLQNFESSMTDEYRSQSDIQNFQKGKRKFTSLDYLGFEESKVPVSEFEPKLIADYHEHRDFPGENATTKLGPHLRFGTLSIRKLLKEAREKNQTFLSELIWREFFMMILYHFPHVVNNSFKPKYDSIEWLNDPGQFEAWCNGQTGYPMVDAGMRELNETGFMHNRVRMVVASFLCKHLLIDWRWGEAYFAKKLHDYELASNNGNWQWAAGCGCDAAPYFRVFNPETQMKKFDPNLQYIKKWVPEYLEFGYPQRIVEHKFARQRAIDTYKQALA